MKSVHAEHRISATKLIGWTGSMMDKQHVGNLGAQEVGALEGQGSQEGPRRPFKGTLLATAITLPRSVDGVMSPYPTCAPAGAAHSQV